MLFVSVYLLYLVQNLTVQRFSVILKIVNTSYKLFHPDLTQTFINHIERSTFLRHNQNRFAACSKVSDQVAYQL